MLVLSRKVDELVVIDLRDLRELPANGLVLVKVVRVQGDVVKLGFLSPRCVPILRSELLHPTDAHDVALAPVLGGEG